MDTLHIGKRTPHTVEQSLASRCHHAGTIGGHTCLRDEITVLSLQLVYMYLDMLCCLSLYFGTQVGRLSADETECYVLRNEDYLYCWLFSKSQPPMLGT